MSAATFSRVTAMAAASAVLAGCMQTYPLESYPWALPDYPSCERIFIGSGTAPPPRACIEGHGLVQTSDGTVIPPDFVVETTLADQGGSTTTIGRGPEFHFTMNQEHIMRASLYAWTATVRATEHGPVLYSTPRPQVFQRAYPIVVIVTPVAAAGG